MLNDMGTRVLTSVFCICLLPSSFQERHGTVLDEKPILSGDKELKLHDNTVHGIPSESSLGIPTMNHQPYDLLVYNLEGLNQYGEIKDIQMGGGGLQGTYSINDDYNQDDFDSSENNYLDTNDYKKFKTVTSMSSKNPQQIETIQTATYHKEVEPYQIDDFQEDELSKHEQEQAEVHYHQHKHLHKHNHDQNHVHKHRQEHKHKHGHTHESRSHHEHKHESQHEHSHHSQNNHHHKNDHGHRHHQEHKHVHQAWHKHDHKHQQDHKHDQHHNHKHEHHASHKHSHHDEHKHGHHHSHKHESEHEHAYRHHGYHKHQHSKKGDLRHHQQGHHSSKRSNPNV